MNAISRDRMGPASVDEMSMAAVDRCFKAPDYRRNRTLARAYHQLHGMDDTQRENMRAARKWADGGFTHLPDEVTRPREWL